jgi:mannose-6-phosphate isomerase-like protein (cupin superfamily)
MSNGSGPALVLIWSDVAAARWREYSQWHSEEHLPERLVIPGFVDGRRYVAARSNVDSLWFGNMVQYEVRGLEVLRSAEYLQLLNSPTERSAGMLRSFLRGSRGVYTVSAAAGSGVGGTQATLCWAGEDKLPSQEEKDVALTLVASCGGVLRARWCDLIEDPSAANGPTAEARTLHERPAAAELRFSQVLLVEGVDLGSVEDSVIAALEGPLAAATPQVGCYSLCHYGTGQAVSAGGAPRRVITGHDEQGKSVVLSDGTAPVFRRLDESGATFYEVWATDGAPAPISRAEPSEPTARTLRVPPEPKGTKIRVNEFLPGHLDTADLQSPVHRTETIDYGIVLEGSMVLVLDDEEVELAPGDVVIQRGTSHAWANRTDRVAKMAFMLVDGEFTGDLKAALPADAIDGLMHEGPEG